MGMTVLFCTMFDILYLIQGLHLTDLQSGPEEGSQDAVGSGNLCRVTEVIKDVYLASREVTEKADNYFK